MFNSVDSEHVDKLTVTGMSLVALSSSFLENQNLFALRMLLQSCIDSRVLNQRSSNGRVVCRAHQKNVIQADLSSNFVGQLFDHDAIIFGHLVLDAEQPDHSEDVLGMMRQSNSVFGIMDVHDSFLCDSRSLLCFLFQSFLPLFLFLEKRQLPLVLSIFVFLHFVEFLLHRLTTLAIELLKVLAEHSVLGSGESTLVLPRGLHDGRTLHKREASLG